MFNKSLLLSLMIFFTLTACSGGEGSLTARKTMTPEVKKKIYQIRDNCMKFEKPVNAKDSCTCIASYTAAYLNDEKLDKVVQIYVQARNQKDIAQEMMQLISSDNRIRLVNKATVKHCAEYIQTLK